MKKIIFKLLLVSLIILCIVGIGVWQVFGPISKEDKPVLFTIPEKQDGLDIAAQLLDQKLIKNQLAFSFALNIVGRGKKIASGGFKLNQNMNNFQIIQKLTSKPDLVWITIPEGLRKEQIGIILADKLGWDGNTLTKWNTEDTRVKPEYYEGVYFPDTYLIPVDETGAQIAKRLIDRFNEKTADLLSQFAKKDILWTTSIKVASLIQREAGGIEDMKVISGVIWNRLDKKMQLEIDATLQYLQGEIAGEWWAKVDLASKNSDSPYNLYLNKGLPPTPICNPGLDAIAAALNPEDTKCLFYLHDHDRQIHCSITYEEHLQNIEKYLK